MTRDGKREAVGWCKRDQQTRNKLFLESRTLCETLTLVYISLVGCGRLLAFKFCFFSAQLRVGNPRELHAIYNNKNKHDGHM